MAFENFNTKPPEEQVAQNSQPEVVATPTDAPVIETPSAQATPAEPPKVVEPPKVDEFIENLNKRYGTQFKAEEEVKGIFELPKKVTEYEGKLKTFDEATKSAEQYKKELEELRTNGLSEFLDKPLIRNAFVASKLQEKYPDKDPYLLQEIAMQDVSKMDDLEAVAKEQKINFPHLKLEDLKKAIASELGLDPETKPEEWDSVVKTRLAIKGAQAKENIKNLLKGIEVPKTATKEEREQALATARQEVEKAIAPVRDRFNKFDKYTNGDFDFDVPTEFKDKVDNIFKGMFLDSGLAVNEQNLATAELFKRAMFVEEYFPKIREVLVAQGYTKHKEEVEKLLNNDQPPNTTTAADQVATPEYQGVSKFFQDEKTQRVTKL
jgi:hypothetical protein